MLKKVIFIILVATCPSVIWSAQYYADPVNGDDTNSGTGISLPWLTLAHSIKQLRAGDTLNLRAGVFSESQLAVNIAGNAQNWITIKAWNNENVSVDGRIKAFSQINNSAWELVDAGRSIYRSTAAFEVDKIHGYLDAANGHWRLVSYEDYGPFSTDNEFFDADPPYYYVEPGLFYHALEKRIYVRLQHSIYQKSMGLELPENLNPNNNALILFDNEQVFLFDNGAAYIEFENINVRYQNSAVEMKTGSHHIQFSNASMIGGRDFFLIRDGAHDVVIDNIDFPGYIPPWIARSDVKRPSEGRPAHLMQSSAINMSDGAYAVEIKNCSFDHHFDAIDATKFPHDLYIHDNRFTVIRDDVLQLGSAAWNIEVADNVLKSVAAGFSWNGSGEPPDNKRGSVYVHHNIIDSAEFLLYGRLDPNNELDDKHDGPNGDGMATGRAFGMHTKSAITGGGAPWKIYHNTVVVSLDVDNRGTGAAYYIEAFDSLVPHEVYNNIFWQKWDGFILREARTHDQSQIFDGNLYYRSSSTNEQEKFYQYYDQVGGSYQHFQNLSDFVGSPDWEATQNYYASGWDSNSLEADPELDEHYRPPVNGSAANGAIDLSLKSWPGLRNEVFRGALAPISNELIFADSFEML